MNKGVDYVGLTVTFLCHDGEGNFVLSKRSENCRDEHGRWDFGGGGVDFGLSVEETLKKEIKEEYCTDIIEKEFLGYRDLFREQDGKKTHWVSLYFKVLVDSEQVDNGEPHKFEEVKWFSIDNLPEPLHSQAPPMLEKFKDNLRS